MAIVLDKLLKKPLLHDHSDKVNVAGDSMTGVLDTTHSFDVPYGGGGFQGTRALRFKKSDDAIGVVMSIVGGNDLWIQMLSGASGISIKDSSNGTVLRFLASGLTAVGTASPAGRFHIVPASSATRGFIVQSNAAQTIPNFQMFDSASVVKFSILDNRMRIYNTNGGFGSESFADYERLAISPVSNVFTFASEAGGTGTVRNFNFTGGKIGIAASDPQTKLDVNDDSIRVRTAKTPASATDTGIQGQLAWDADYLYVCTATDTWKRTAVATW